MRQLDWHKVTISQNYARFKQLIYLVLIKITVGAAYSIIYLGHLNIKRQMTFFASAFAHF